MGQSLQTVSIIRVVVAPGNKKKKAKEIIGAIAGSCYDKYRHFYDKYFVDDSLNGTKEWSPTEFRCALSETIEKMNKKLAGNTQVPVPNKRILKRAFEHHYKGNPLTEREFEKILREVMAEPGFSGTGAKGIFFYTFGVTATALFFKQRILPRATAIPNEILIPAVTSAATVFVLAKLNKI